MAGVRALGFGRAVGPASLKERVSLAVTLALTGRRTADLPHAMRELLRGDLPAEVFGLSGLHAATEEHLPALVAGVIAGRIDGATAEISRAGLKLAPGGLAAGLFGLS
jgi:hypothetical protein